MRIVLRGKFVPFANFTKGAARFRSLGYGTASPYFSLAMASLHRRRLRRRRDAGALPSKIQIDGVPR